MNLRSEKNVFFSGMLVLLIGILPFSALAYQVQKGPVKILVRFELPKDHEFTAKAPHQLELKTDAPEFIRFQGSGTKVGFSPLDGPYEIPLEVTPGKGNVLLEANLYYCHKQSKLCLADRFPFKIPLVIQEKGPSVLRVALKVKPPKRSSLLSQASLSPKK